MENFYAVKVKLKYLFPGFEIYDFQPFLPRREYLRRYNDIFIMEKRQFIYFCRIPSLAQCKYKHVFVASSKII